MFDMSSKVHKRITLKPRKCPNPLFKKWLTEWKTEAKEKDSDMKYVYAKALASLIKYPLVLKTGRECGILQNFGVKICSMLDKKLEEHNRQLGKDCSIDSPIRGLPEIPPSKKTKQAKPKKNKPLPSVPDVENVILHPGSYKIKLIVDSGETSGLKGKAEKAKRPQKDQILNHLSKAGVDYEVKKLSVGDFAWACVPFLSESESSNIDEKSLMLPYVVERKRVDDLGSSIRDGRFHEQKFRLKQSGMWQLIYLVEGISEKLGIAEKTNSRGLHLPVSTLQQASVNTEVVDHFIVKDTKGQKETAEYLSLMTNCLKQLVQEKILKKCAKDDLPEFSVNDDVFHLMSMSEFNKSSIKCKELTVSQMFVRHLLQIRGLSVEKALAIVEKYPTPAALLAAYEENHANRQILLAKLTYGPNSRQIGPTLSKVVCNLYTNAVLT
ncbi:hypothetical protein J437_LFUL008007 [Ladona fulva]|uniref:Crossover junction endonuclease MUS81 n=1 Tax=Ladona fulva TaxID=123851 RepID=A0A8K0K3N3_LADFU|nr:hypothetical protein J437_LFUL008007 [Ladona fulva]